MGIILKNKISNMREMGGIKNKENKAIKDYVIIRSNCPENLDRKDFGFFKQKGINNVIDLRDIDEYEKKVSSFEKTKDFNLYHISIQGGREIPKSKEEVPISYLRMIEENKKEFQKIFEIIAKENGGILYYCNAGKDRTGVLTTLILLLLNIEDKVIVDDYMITKKCQEKFLNDYIFQEKDESLRERIIPHEEFITEFIRLLKEKYGTVEEYLYDIGIDKKSVNKIKNKLLI